MNEGRTATGVVTGKPFPWAVAWVVVKRRSWRLRRWLRSCCEKGVTIAGAKIAVQGFGNVGGIAARLFAEAGSKVVAVQRSRRHDFPLNGLDVPKLLDHVAANGSVTRFPRRRSRLAERRLLESTVRHLDPQPLWNNKSLKLTQTITARLFSKARIFPLHQKLMTISENRGVLVVPDVIANAGGVTVFTSNGYKISPAISGLKKKSINRLTRIMKEAFNSVWYD